METLTILGLLLAAILLFLIVAFWRSTPAPDALPTSDEEFLVRIDQAQVQLEQEQARRAAVEQERERLEAALAEMERALPVADDAVQRENERLSAEAAASRQQLAEARAEIEKLQTQLAEHSQVVTPVQAFSDGDDVGLVELRHQLADVETQLLEAQALAGQFPIQAAEIKQLEHELNGLRAERDDLKAKVTEAAVYIRDVQKRYQLVLDKMRQLLVQREREVSPESLAPLQQELEEEALDSQTDYAPEDTGVAVAVSQLLPKDRPVQTPPAEAMPRQGNGVHKSPFAVSVTEATPVAPTSAAHEDEIPKTEFMPIPPDAEAVADQSADLQVIKGIGKVYAQRLREAGIHSLPELIRATPEQLREVTGIQTWHRADPDSWISQARQLLASS